MQDYVQGSIGTWKDSADETGSINRESSDFQESGISLNPCIIIVRAVKNPGTVNHMPSIKETSHQMVQFVFPEHANTHGTLHGGRLMDWIMLAGSINSSRISRGITVLGATDSIDFINPVKVGEIVTLDSSIEYIGTSSMEIGVTVHSENLETREKKLTTTAHLAFIAVDNNGKPRHIDEKIEPDKEEKALYEEARKRRELRTDKISIRDEQARNIIDETEITRMRL